MVNPADPYDLDRFVSAQHGVYDTALAEIRTGGKRSHWMWYVIPQFDGLGSSATSRHYAIKSLAEAEAFLAHPVLGRRLRECVTALLAVAGHSAYDIFGSPDDLKLRSCATLFARAAPSEPLFARLLDRYFGGEPDARTLTLIAASRPPTPKSERPF
jgi:uncharacterized protein (DUF1810 family)